MQKMWSTRCCCALKMPRGLFKLQLQALQVYKLSRSTAVPCRCWNYSTEVGSVAEHPTLCERCIPVIRDMGFQLVPPEALNSPVAA